MSYTIETKTGEKHTFEDIQSVYDWADENVTKEWRAVSLAHFGGVNDEWMAMLTPGQIDEIRHWYYFTLVQTACGAITCQTDDIAMLVLAGEWELASVTVTGIERLASPRDLEAVRDFLKSATRA